jgi:mannose-6-phosphate isomerase-like protein (cupin superfamily)
LTAITILFVIDESNKKHLHRVIMKVFNRHNSNNTGDLKILKSWMLIGPHNAGSQNLSLQISEIPTGSEQPVHNHEPEQCYYIIKGKGLMLIENESQEVKAGDAIFIPSNFKHGIKNLGNEILEYITANAPVFSKEYEATLWPAAPKK